MRLVFVAQESGKGPGGVVTVLRHLCRGWSRDDRITCLINRNHPADDSLFQEGHEQSVHVVVKRLRFPLPSDWRVKRLILKLALRPLRWLWMGGFLLYLTMWFRRRRVEGVLSHNGGWPGGELNRLAIYAAWLAGVPKRFLVIHNTPWQPPGVLRAFYRLYGRLVGQLATEVITVSDDCRQALETVAGLGSVRVIYNGIASGGWGENPSQRPGSARGKPPWTKQYPTIGFIGEMHPRKGVHVLVDALREVAPPCELVLVGDGDGSYVRDIQEMAGTLRHPVHFLGFRDDAQLLYSWMDLVVLPSMNYESFGMVIVEAMRAGIAVICSDFGGMKEVVADGETGLVVPAGDVHALAKALERLLRDETLRQRMGKAGSRRLQERFTAEVMVGRYRELVHCG